jgi:type IV pilus assembly protein PilA
MLTRTIAIPVFLNQRASARDASVKADINGIAKVMETVYTDTGTYPTVATGAAAMLANNAVTSPGNFIRVVPGSTAFEIYGCNAESDKGWYYSSATGGLKANSALFLGTACTTAGAVRGAVKAPNFLATELFTAPS